MTLSGRVSPAAGRPSRYPHSRIEPRVRHVHERIRNYDEKRAVDDGGHDRWQVKVLQRLVSEIADAVYAEHDLDQNRAAADQRPEVQAEQAHESDHGSPDDVVS